VTVYNGCDYNARYQGSGDLHVVAQHLGTENKYSFGMLYGVHVYGVSGTVVAANRISVASNAVFVQASDGFVEGSGQVGSFTDNYFATDPEGSTDLSLADAPWYGGGNLIQANLQAQCE
jgi:hypothetical protein